MTTTTGTGEGLRPALEYSRHGRTGHWIDDWRPEEPGFWAAIGSAVARRNLVFSIFS
jgi:MFS transporter, NNP family, nitrate/nitrite transporter